MRIQKTSRQPASSGLLPGHLEDINRLSRASLSAEEVYVFSLCLCDNEVDRDQERFPEKTLEQLAPLFVGKSGLSPGGPPAWRRTTPGRSAVPAPGRRVHPAPRACTPPRSAGFPPAPSSVPAPDRSSAGSR